mmetsp:Transcript_36767/g.86189  ORF Transcript_36767/g.86189 Transcript_36767/m.86189 type:complete len:308 (-) Transcript_36767:55-978(-)
MCFTPDEQALGFKVFGEAPVKVQLLTVDDDGAVLHVEPHHRAAIVGVAARAHEAEDAHGHVHRQPCSLGDLEADPVQVLEDLVRDLGAQSSPLLRRARGKCMLLLRATTAASGFVAADPCTLLLVRRHARVQHAVHHHHVGRADQHRLARAALHHSIVAQVHLLRHFHRSEGESEHGPSKDANGHNEGNDQLALVLLKSMLHLALLPSELEVLLAHHAVAIEVKLSHSLRRGAGGSARWSPFPCRLHIRRVRGLVHIEDPRGARRRPCWKGRHQGWLFACNCRCHDGLADSAKNSMTRASSPVRQQR